jgi:hypothetical protein
LYAANFEEWCSRFHRNGNPLYMPETRGGAAGAENVFYALGEDAGLGFSPFGIDSEAGEADPLAESYKAIAAVSPMLLEHQARGDVHGFLLDRDRSSVDFAMNGYSLHVTLDSIFGNTVESGYGLIMADGKDGFLGVGKGFRVTFSASGANVGIGAVDEGKFEDGKWIAGRRLNGDENDQGTHWRFDSDAVHTEKVTLFRFERGQRSLRQENRGCLRIPHFVLTCDSGQKTRCSPPCNWRAEFCTLLTRPNEVELGETLAAANCGRLKALNASMRSCSTAQSPARNPFRSEKSQLFSWSCRNRFCGK